MMIMGRAQRIRTRLVAQTAIRLWACASLALIGAAPAAFAAETKSEPAAAEAINQAAVAELTRMADCLGGTQNFSYVAYAAADVVQSDGQKLEFPETRKVAVSRPDHVRSDILNNDGEETVFTFDGKRIALYHKTDNVLATTETAGTIDDAIDTLTKKFGVRVPLAMLLSSKLGDTLRKKITAADIIGTSSLRGVVCTHIAARTADVDLQVWVQEGDQPFPRRVVLTYRKEQGQPQYRAELTDWKISATRDNSLVTHEAPADAEPIDFHPVPASSKASSEAKGERK